jgi:hypothetical protein
MNSSDQTDQLAAAFAIAQASFDRVIKDATAKIPGKNGKQGYEYSYAGLATTLAAVRPSLAANGLSHASEAAAAEGGINITTRLMHTSGQWIEAGPLFMPCAAAPQDAGSAISYGRRYQLQALLGLAAEDDDGCSAQATATSPDVQPEASAKACRAKVEQLAALTDSAPPDVWALWCERLKFEPMQDGGPPTAFDLTTHEGQLMWDALEGEIRRIETRSSEPDGNPATASPAPYLARKGARCGGRATPLGAEVRKLVGELGEQLGKAWGATWAAVLRKDGAGIPPTVEPEQLLTVDATRLVARLQTAILNIEAKAIEREPGDDADEVPEDDAAELARVEQRLGATFPGTTKASPSKRSRAEAPS